MLLYRDIGLSNVWLVGGHRVVTTPYGNAIQFDEIHDLHASLAATLIRKPARLCSGEFVWLRRYARLTQGRVAELLDRTEQSISLIERDETPIGSLVDREFRRLIADSLGTHFRRQIGSVVEMAARTNSDGNAKFIGTFSNGKWAFETNVIIAQDDRHVTVTVHQQSGVGETSLFDVYLGAPQSFEAQPSPTTMTAITRRFGSVIEASDLIRLTHRSKTMHV